MGLTPALDWLIDHDSMFQAESGELRAEVRQRAYNRLADWQDAKGEQRANQS